MSRFSLWKNFKRRLRRARRPIWALGCCLFIIGLSQLILTANIGEAAVQSAEGVPRLAEKIDDLSEACKNNNVIGLDKEGSSYDGSPENEKMIRTFFQINMKVLESSLPQGELDKLLAGIRVKDRDELL